MNEATINLSLSTKNIINVNNSAYLTFKKITLTSTRSDAININGNHNNVEDCTIKNCAGSGIVVNGHNNKVYNCEIMKMGKGGILLSGGNPEELYSARNIADNNHIHHYGEIYKTYWAGISLSGVGNICSHNEIHDAPHMAIFYDGFNHLIEYNYIHDVVKNSTDAGAVYSGRSFVKYGNVLRYNCIYNIGSNEFKPQGIYFDDAFSGQIVYGNVLINIPENAILIGGGSNMDVYNNLIINAKYGIHYDDRARDGVINKGWFRGHVQYEDSPMWIEFYESPYKSMLWKKAFPRLYSMHGNFEDADSPYFAANPSLSIIKNNVILAKDQKIIKIAESVYRFSKIESNALFHLDDEIGFIDMKNGNYNLKKDSKIFREVETFENIPFEKIGRY